LAFSSLICSSRSDQISVMMTFTFVKNDIAEYYSPLSC
jgi:hypothetical protein